MDTSVEALRHSITCIIKKIDAFKNEPLKERQHILRLSEIEHKFKSYHVEVTPKPVLSDLYTCVGRMKFYADGMLFMYLEMSENNREPLPWPVKATWSVELLDEDDSKKTYCLGNMTCNFNRPRQGFVSHCNDWLSVNLDKLKISGFIAPDNSITMKWTVVTQPVLQDIYFAQFEELLKNAEKYFEIFHCSELKQIKEKVAHISNESKIHADKIINLEKLLPSIHEKLTQIEDKQSSIEGILKKQ